MSALRVSASWVSSRWLLARFEERIWANLNAVCLRRPSPFCSSRVWVLILGAKDSAGAALLGRVLSIAASMAIECGCVGILVDAKAGAVGFYEKHDFQWLLPPAADGTRRGFLSIRTIEAGFAPH